MIRTTIAATLAALALTSCAATSAAPSVTVTAAPAPVVTEAPIVTPAPVVTPDAVITPELTDTVFLQIVNAVPAATQYDDGAMIDLAYSMCDMFDAGANVEMIFLVALDYDVDMDVVATILGAGVAAYCPEYTDLLQ